MFQFNNSQTLLHLKMKFDLRNNDNENILLYMKNRNEKKISMKSLKSKLSSNVLVDQDVLIMKTQYRYKPSLRTPLVQQWFMEILYTNAGAVIKHRTQLTNNINRS